MCALFQVGPFLQQPILWKKCTVLSFLSPCRVLDQSSSLFLGFWTHSSSPACARAHSQWPSLPERWAINQSPKIHGIRVWTRDTTPTCGSSSSSQVFLFFSMSYNKICIIKSTTFSFSKISIIFTSQKKLPGAFDRGQERCLHLSPLSPILQWFRKKRQFYNFLPRNLYVHDQGVFFWNSGETSQDCTGLSILGHITVWNIPCRLAPSMSQVDHQSLSDFHCVCVSETWDDVYLMKALSNSFQILISWVYFYHRQVS